MSIRILIADDHGVLRAGLRELLNAEPGFEVVGEAADGAEAISLSQKLQPDIVLMDLRMPGNGGIQTTRQLLEEQPDVSVLVLTVHDDDLLLREAIKAGASGYILKRAAESELIDAIWAVSRGDLYIHPAMTRSLFSDRPDPAPATRPTAATLTPREVEVLQLVAQGYTNRQVAQLLTISVRTVESHRANLMDKLDLNSRVELVRFASRQGLLEEWPDDSADPEDMGGRSQ